MHGRLKIKSSEQQQAERRAERTSKCVAYKSAMQAILDRRESGGGTDVANRERTATAANAALISIREAEKATSLQPTQTPPTCLCTLARTLDVGQKHKKTN